MKSEINSSDLLKEILNEDNFLIVQDIDGVCIPLVKEPLKREIDVTYIEAAKSLGSQFAVLTNGEHEGLRGVNRVVERAYAKAGITYNEDFYLPGLAAGGIEYQNRLGEVKYPGVSEKELDFLNRLPKEMERLLNKNLIEIFPLLKSVQIESLAKSAVISTKFSPTINLNGIFSTIPNDIALQKRIQSMLRELMSDLLISANDEGLEDSFYLHIAPNLGKSDNKERLKFASLGDVGTTDIQFMLSGAIKEAGLLVLINKYVQEKFGRSPLGDDFNVRNAPKSLLAIKSLCHEQIREGEMPILIGVGDTVTSNPSPDGKGWLRGGSDRGFLTLIQELGRIYKKENRIVLVDSSHGEVDRPTLSDNELKGISDPYDPLQFNTYFRGGPKSYVEWFKQLAKERNIGI